MEYRKKTCENASLVKKNYSLLHGGYLMAQNWFTEVFFMQFDAIFVSFYLEFV